MQPYDLPNKTRQPQLQWGNLRRNTVSIALIDYGQVGSCATNSLSDLLHCCLIELTRVQQRDDTSALELEQLAACNAAL